MDAEPGCGYGGGSSFRSLCAGVGMGIGGGRLGYYLRDNPHARGAGISDGGGMGDGSGSGYGSGRAGGGGNGTGSGYGWGKSKEDV